MKYEILKLGIDKYQLKYGDKKIEGDNKTPECVNRWGSGVKPPSNLFHVMQIDNKATATHNYDDGRGNVKAYGKWFLRLKLNGHKCDGNNSIGIHGHGDTPWSTPGRNSGGCIRLTNDNILIVEQYVKTNTKVYIGTDTESLPDWLKKLDDALGGDKRNRDIDVNLQCKENNIGSGKASA